MRALRKGPIGLQPSLSGALQAAELWEGDGGERRMVAAMLRWMLQARWFGSATTAAFEVPWRGRRIDLVTVNGKGQLSSFEFKLGGTRRVFEQAIYNSASSHRSYVVSGGVPGERYRELARSQGIGIFVVNGSANLLERPALCAPHPQLIAALRERALRVATL